MCLCFKGLVLLGVTLSFSACTKTYTTEVDTAQKISELLGQFSSNLSDGDQFGYAIENIGDLENDGVIDLAVGAPFDNSGGADKGAVWILFLDIDGQVDIFQKISDNDGGFAGGLGVNDHFGFAITQLGDLNGDGLVDIAVGAPGADDGGLDRGAVWILFMNADGTVQSHQKIADSIGGFSGTLDNDDAFGSAIANIGDVNNDGIVDIAVGAPNDDDNGIDRGAVWILYLNQDGSINGQQKLSAAEGNFSGILDDVDHFGSALDSLGDLNKDGFVELVVGAPGDDDGGTDRGSVWILFLDANALVFKEEKISQIDGEFDNFLFNGDNFGISLANIGDMNNDGIDELVVGANLTDDGGADRGAFWVIFLRKDGSVISTSKISDLSGNFTSNLSDSDHFASSVVGLGDLDGDLVLDLAAGVNLDDDGGVDRGAVWVLFMEPVEIGSRVDRDATLFTIYANKK